MTAQGIFQIAVFFALVIAAAVPLGGYMARVYEGEPIVLERVLGPLERLIYRLAGVRRDEETTWSTYALAMLLFNIGGILLTYAILRLQATAPLGSTLLNPQRFAAPPPDLAWNTAVSFATNTNWQSYGGESTLSYASQMVALTVQNFVCAASGMAVLVALVRGITRKTSSTIGSFWVDLVRGTLYVLLPLALVLALALVSQGVVQTFHPYQATELVQPTRGADGNAVTEQVIALGPAASQIAIKMLGTNGGGFFNANSAHPFENPNGLTNFLEMFALLVLPAALCFTFGKLVKDVRQGWALFAAMSAILLPLLVVCVSAEQAGNPTLRHLAIDQAASALQSGGNMEGKEVRFGIANTGLFATITTAVSCGAVNGMHDSFTPIGGLVPMWLIQLGEVVFGGVGAGLYGMLMFAVVAVFVAGLMVGRTPEYLGKKIEAKEMKMASLVVLVPPATVLLMTAIACVTEAGKKGVYNPGPHGFSEILYAFSSAANNNGSAFGGLSANTPFYNTLLGVAMFLGRYFVKVPVLALAGALAAKKAVPASAGTLPTHTPLFVAMLVGVVVLVGALTFVPALALGPIVEHLLAATP
jgi:potassium-transporting ATPase potassium-binding subunit